jgi:serine/threonine protein phosphatase PrpC
MVEGLNQESEATEVTGNHPEAAATVDWQLLEWRMTGETVRGNSHLRDGRPNQDAILQIRESGIYAPIILSMSDGHGSNKCFRSDRGSHIAVTLSALLMRELLNRKPDDSDIERAVKETFPAEFVRRWQRAVERDIKNEPFSKEELAQLEEKDSAQARQIVEAHPLLAYGATSLTVALTGSLVIYAQLGDGEILCVSETGEVSKPLFEDDRLIANETTSLCTDTAAQDFRIACQSFTQALPALIILTTDGYANSFVDDAGFLQVGSDLLTMLRSEGFDSVSHNVKGWLAEATQLGSGDDCTLGIICRMDTLQSAPGSQPMPAEGLPEDQQLIAQEDGKEVNDTNARQFIEKN